MHFKIKIAQTYFDQKKIFLFCPHFLKIKVLNFSKYFLMAKKEKVEEKGFTFYISMRKRNSSILKESLLVFPFCLVGWLGRPPISGQKTTDGIGLEQQLCCVILLILTVMVHSNPYQKTFLNVSAWIHFRLIKSWK